MTASAPGGASLEGSGIFRHRSRVHPGRPREETADVQGMLKKWLVSALMLVHGLLCRERVADVGHCDHPLRALGLAGAAGFLKLLRNGVVESDCAACDMV